MATTSNESLAYETEKMRVRVDKNTDDITNLHIKQMQTKWILATVVISMLFINLSFTLIEYFLLYE